MPKEVNGNKQSKEKKHFMKDFKAELKKVTWPTPKQLANNTLAVIVIVIITAIIVAVLDLTFRSIDTYGIEGIKSLVDKQNEVTANEIDANIIDENSIDENAVDNSTENETADNQEDAADEEQNSEEKQEDTKTENE